MAVGGAASGSGPESGSWAMRACRCTSRNTSCRPSSNIAPRSVPSVAEPAVFGDAAGGVVAEGVGEFQAVEAEAVEGPAGAEGEGTGGDALATGLGKDPVADAGDAQVRRRCR